MGQQLGLDGEPGAFPLSDSLAEFEADVSPMRTREGMSIARAKGRLEGNQPARSGTRRSPSSPVLPPPALGRRLRSLSQGWSSPAPGRRRSTAGPRTCRPHRQEYLTRDRRFGICGPTSCLLANTGVQSDDSGLSVRFCPPTGIDLNCASPIPIQTVSAVAAAQPQGYTGDGR